MLIKNRSDPLGLTLRDISGKVKDCITDRSINVVELGYNVMKRLNILCRYKGVLS
jgi:hypothetical protein